MICIALFQSGQISTTYCGFLAKWDDVELTPTRCEIQHLFMRDMDALRTV